MSSSPQAEGSNPEPKDEDDGNGKLLDTAMIVEAFGGPRGLLESTVPGVVFALFYAATKQNLATSLWAALISAVLILIVAVVQRRSVQQTISGFIGVLLMAGIALWTGRARDFYLLGLFRNGFFLTAYLVSIVVGWPLVGLFVGPFTGEGTAWRRNKARRRAYVWCSWCWVALFGIRLAIQYKLFAADRVVALGFAGIILGLPLFLLVCLANYLILRRVPLAIPAEDTLPEIEEVLDDDDAESPDRTAD